MSVTIVKISINDNGVLCLYPKGKTFEMIYRSAMGVHWNEDECFLYHNASIEWSPLQWYYQIIKTVKNEYGIIFKIDSNIIFENLDNNFISEIGGELH